MELNKTYLFLERSDSVFGSLEKEFINYFKFKGFKEESFKEKVKWILLYPLNVIIFIVLVIYSLINR